MKQLKAKATKKNASASKPNKAPELRKEVFYVTATDFLAAMPFASQDEARKQMTGFLLDDKGIYATDGKRAIGIEYELEQSPKDYFSPAILSAEFVYLFTEAARLAETESLPVAITVFERVGACELNLGLLYAEAYKIERPCLEGKFPDMKAVLPVAKPDFVSSEMLDARFYLDAVKSAHLVTKHEPIKKADFHFLDLRCFTAPDKKGDTRMIGYYTDRLKIVIMPLKRSVQEDGSTKIEVKITDKNQIEFSEDVV